MRKTFRIIIDIRAWTEQEAIEKFNYGNLNIDDYDFDEVEDDYDEDEFCVIGNEIGDIPAAKQWCHDNNMSQPHLGPIWDGSIQGQQGIDKLDRVEYWFDNDVDAMAFRLRWA